MEAQLSDIVSVLKDSHVPGEDYRSLTSAQTGVDITAFDDSDVQLEVYRDSIKPNAKQVVEHIEMVTKLSSSLSISTGSYIQIVCIDV